MFALTLVPVVGSVGAAVDYSQANSIRSAMQAAADVAALGSIKTASTLSAAQVQSTAQGLFTSSFNRSNATPTVSASYDAASTTVTVNATASFTPSFVKMVEINQMNMSVSSKATVGGSKTWPVCVLVTDPNSGHTELVSNNSTIDFYNCMNQVNTLNWDAVEARDTSYIHSTNGVNCFTGDIHYGDVTPPKEATCTMLNDPYINYAMPSSASTCNFTGLQVKTSGTALNPGTYCNGLDIQIDTTFNPGLYVIKDGQLKVSNAKTINATGVTFLLTGNNAGLNIDMTKYSGSAFNITPDMNSDAGQFAGFLFFLDQTPGSDGHTHYQGQSVLKGVTMNTNGIIYLTGQQLQMQNNSNITINPGSLIAGYILPQSSKLSLTGNVNAPGAAAAAMKKSITSNTPVLVR